MALTAIESSHGMWLWRRHHGALLLLLAIANTNGLSFSIHRVSTQEYCLDTIAFRRWGMRCDRRARFADQQSSTSSSGAISAGDEYEKEMDELQMTRNELESDRPKDTMKYEAFSGSTIQFAALHESDSLLMKENFLTQIVGVIEAESLEATKGRTFTLPDRLHIANLRTHHKYRRQGIGKALVQAVVQHAMGDQCRTYEQGSIEAVTLKVERDLNPKAARLYEHSGFEFEEKVYPGFMIKSLN